MLLELFSEHAFYQASKGCRQDQGTLENGLRFSGTWYFSRLRLKDFTKYNSV